MGISPEDALTILAEEALLPEGADVERCGFRRGGKTLPTGGRVDIIECAYADTMAFVSAAFLVIRPTNLQYQLTVQELTTVTSVPGEEGSYALGALSLRDGKIAVSVKETWVTIGNTGEPDEPSDRSVERVKKEFACEYVEERYWECEQTNAPRTKWRP
jgi:hypothetical protein